MTLALYTWGMKDGVISHDAAQRARAKARAAWSVQVLHLEADAQDDLSAFTTPEARLGMMWPLALEAWGLAERPLPTYKRAHLPVSISFTR